jgi:hypothetical protein
VDSNEELELSSLKGNQHHKCFWSVFRQRVLPIFPFSCVGPSPEFQEEQNASQVKTVA